MNRLKKTLFALAAAAALGLLGASNAAAQCTATSAGSTVRQEGTTELIGAIRIDCTSTNAFASSSISVTLSGVSFSPTAGNNTDSFNITAGGTVVTSSSCSGGVTTVANNTDNFPCPTIAPNVAFAVSGPGGLVTTSVSGTTVTFSGITPAAAAQTILIRNLRANIAASGLQAGAVILATVTFGAGSGFVGGGTFNVATVASAINRLSSGTGFARGTGTAATTQTVDIFGCAPNRRTPAGTPDTATAADILGAGLTLADNRSTNVLIQSTAGLLRTALTEDPQALTASVSGPVGTWLAIAGALNGARIAVTLTGVPSGINVYVLRSISNTATNPTNPAALVGITGGGVRFTRVGGAESDGSGGGVGADIVSQFDRVPTVGDTVTIVYELVENTGAAVSAVRFPIVFTGNPPISLGNINGTFGMAPVGPPTKAQGRPQFQAAPAAVRIARTLACQSYLLFPWIVHRINGSFSTGFAIANTSMDPITGASTTPAVPHAGDVTLNFYRSRSADGANPAAVKIATALEGGRTTTFIMSQLTPEGDFDGYVIAYCTFAFGHGFAFINSPAPGSGGQFAQGYLAISLAVDRDFSVNSKTESAGN